MLSSDELQLVQFTLVPKKMFVPASINSRTVDVD